MNYVNLTKSYSGTNYEASNKVLQNALNFVGLSMIPTAIAAYLVSLIPMSYYVENPILMIGLFIGNFLLSLGLMFWAFKASNSAMGIVAMLFFAASMGAGLGPMINKTLNMSNGISLILSAALATGASLFAITAYVKHTKKDFSFMKSFLFGGLIAVLVLSVVGMFFQSTVFQLMLSSVAVVLFLGYLLYDISRIVTGGETNYVIAAISIYLDVINIFINLLQIFGILGRDD